MGLPLQKARFGGSRQGFETIGRSCCRAFHRSESRYVLRCAEKERLMLGFIFGFNARIGRLRYFLATLALAVVMAAVAYGLAISVPRLVPKGAIPSIDDLIT
jgi:hypothetical protein